eukprot:m.18965 g.18965  ORF g.18965 m.18965 type:complete len:74 (+) comp3646_c0_seq1:1100-1321(+)
MRGPTPTHAVHIAPHTPHQSGGTSDGYHDLKSKRSLEASHEPSQTAAILPLNMGSARHADTTAPHAAMYDSRG